MTLETQEALDVKMEHKLNALYDVVQSLWDEFQSLNTRAQLKCHTNFEWICVTSSVYNESSIEWEKVNTHLKGIWQDSSESLDLAKIHQEIMNM